MVAEPAPSTGAYSSEDAPPFAIIVLAGIVLLTLAHGAILLFQSIPTLDGEFFGFDTYNRMSRAVDLYEHGNWFDPLDPKINPPQGFISHWTRALDGLIVGLAFLLDVFLPTDRALFWSGTLISPILHVLSFGLGLVLLRPCFSRHWLENLPIMFAMAFGITAAFYIGRPDHQAPMLALLWVSIAFATRIILLKAHAAQGFLLGILLALMTWAVATGFLLAAAFSAGFGLLWCIYGRRFLPTGLAMQLGIVTGLTLCTFLERGFQADILFAMENDRLSFMHVMLMLQPLAFWLIAAWLTRWSVVQSRGRRFLAAIASGVLIGLVLLLAFPDLRPSRVADVDPFYRGIRGGNIIEYQFVLSGDMLERLGLSAALAELMASGWVYIVGLPALVYLLLTRDPMQRRPLWIFIFVLWLLPTLYFYNSHFGLQWARMSMFSIILLLPPCEVLRRMLRSLHLYPVPWSTLGRVALRLAVVAIPLTAQAKVIVANAEDTSNVSAVGTPVEPCRIGGMKHDLESAFLDTGERTFLAVPELSGQLRYHLDATVFAIGQHRRQSGFRRMHEIFSATDMKDAMARLRSEQVDGVVVCADPGIGAAYFGKPKARDHLYARLQDGDPPSYLREVSLPTNGIRVYRFEAPEQAEK